MLQSDITIIGAGPGGYVAAIWAAKLGARVVLVEKEKVGGTCLNWGCIPTKALVRSAEVYQTLKQAEEFGCYADNVRLDLAQVKARKDRIVAQLVKGIEHLLKKNRVTLVQGTARLQDLHTVLVSSGSESTAIQSENIIIATGSSPVPLAIPGVDLSRVIDSRQALELTEVPGTLAIVGGGIIGMEFAFVYAHFGARVVVIELLDDVLSTLDPDIRKLIRLSARRAGIQLYTGARVEAIKEATANGQCVICYTQAGKQKELTADKVLLAVGRRPYLGDLGVKELGIQLTPSGRGIQVNEYMQTNIPNIYAIGDVTDRIQLAHVASHQAIVAVNHIMGRSAKMDYTAIPNAIFTDPEIATVGLSETEAKAQGLEIEVGTFPFAGNGKALTYGSNRGFVKVIAEKASGKIVGAAIVGLHATDLIGELTLAVKNGLTAEQIAATIHAHPTAAEAIHEAALDAIGMVIHV